MRVLVMGSTGTGMARFRKRLLADLALRTDRVFAAAHYEREQDRQVVAAHHAVPIDVYLERAGKNPLRELGSMWRMARVIRETRPDLVLLYTIKPVIYGGLVCRALGVSRCYGMITGIGAAFEPDASGRKTLLRRLVERLYRISLGTMSKVIFQNEDNRKLFVERGLVRASSTVVVPGSGVDLEEYPFTETDATGRAVRFLFLGRYLEDKGFSSYVRAARELRKRGSDAGFFVAGKLDLRSGDEEKHLLDAALRDGSIQDLGFVDDVAKCLSQIDVLVLPSHGEGVPRSVLEAMATGRAIITTDAPGCRDTVTDGTNGRLVPTGDDAALAEAMQDLIENPEKIAPMGRASRNLALRRFSVQRINRMMLQVMGVEHGGGDVREQEGASEQETATERGQHQLADHSGEFPEKDEARDVARVREAESRQEREQNEGPMVSAGERARSRHRGVNRHVSGARDRR